MGSVGLAERLGYRADDRLLIVNCDDLGSRHGANVAAYRAMTAGVATSASLMVPCPHAREAALMFTGLPVGVHLTLTSEYGRHRWRGLENGASLRDEDGFLPKTRGHVLRHADAADVRTECRTQIETALSWGVDVTHLDTHMDVMHGRDDLYDIYLDLAAAFRLPVRMHAPRAGEPQDLKARAAARGILFNEHLVYPWPRRTRDVFFGEIPKLQPGVSEIFAHPVIDGAELRTYDTTNADIRAHDAACLTDSTVSDLLDEHGIRRISYRELRELQRAG